MLIAIAVATFLVYPMFYYELSHNDPAMALVLTLRNALLVVLLWWSARRLYQLGTRRPATAPATAPAAPAPAAAAPAAKEA
jgi:hypothetical protein